ncbi:MAG: chromosome segregation protein SMC [Deltaproteobacteria bacterium RBG_13_61_14]|nr:MAG: chromosome segregation protein SMC [Deltaproteobacteria bacterium RBG_13_61_14]
MKLKKLELCGFKSFVEKTGLVFQDGITCVVGPNGCGKSNVVDAIRWAMGEQSAKHLRGRLMEDVIFNGSQEFVPLGMAEVNLIFDNTDGRAPVEYSGFAEIQVTRRLFRTGESEYLINRAPCRLKDITDLFLGTGVGTRAYSIVEQGQIDRIISAKPEDRRLLLEEAAGVSKYRARRKEAESKIESTRQNLLRIRDIVAEIKRQMNSLNRQAKKAERFKQYRNELREIELNLAVRRALEVKAELERLLAQVAESEDREQEMAGRLEFGEADLEARRVNLLDAERALHHAQENMHLLQNAIQRAEGQIELKRSEVHNFEKQVGRLSTENLSLAEELNRNAGEQEELRLRRAAVQEELAEALAAAASALAEQKTLEEECRRREHLVEQGQANATELVAELSRLQNSLAHAEKRVEEIGQELVTNAAEREQLKSQGEGLRQLSFNFNENLYTMRKLLDSADQELEVQLRGLEQLRQELAAAQARALELQDTHTRTLSRLESLREMQDKLEGLDHGVKAILEERDRLREQGQNGIYGLLAEIIETEPEYVPAVEAVLGERLESVLVSTTRHGRQAVEYLQAEAAGRGTFIPLALREDPIQPLPEPLLAQGARPLLDVVRVPEQYQPVARLLLGEAVLVPSLEKALELWEHNGFHRVFVTSDGSVLDPHGILSGGSRDAAGLLSRRHEIQQLAEEVERLRGERGQVEIRVQALRQQIAEVETELEVVRGRRRRQEIEVLNLERELKRSADEFNAVSRRVHDLEAECDRRQTQVQELLAQAEGLRREIAAKTLARADLLRESEDRRQALGAIRAQAEESAARRTQFQVAAAGLREKDEALASQLERLLRTRAEMEAGRSRREQEVLSIQAEMTAIRAALTQESAALREKLAEKLAAETALTQAREAYERAAAEIREQEASLKELHKNRERLHQEINDLRLKASEFKMQHEHLQESVRDKFFMELEHAVAEREAAVRAESFDPQAEHARAEELKDTLQRMGDVNLTAIEEYKELEERHSFLANQEGDLIEALDSLEKTIAKINTTYRKEFRQTFDAANAKFQEVFPRLFRGGKAMLVLTDEANLLESGVDIVAQPPGKKLQNITLLSGGEKSMTAVSLIISLFLIKPSPFCLLDEVDAALDDLNIDRFNEIVKEMSASSQFILITHNKRTMEMANTLYGITMEKMGVSKVVSVKLN